jgi:hypothetical protein
LFKVVDLAKQPPLKMQVQKPEQNIEPLETQLAISDDLLDINEAEQFPMEIEQGRDQWLSNMKMGFEKTLDYASVNAYWRSMVSVIALVAGVFLISVYSAILFFSYSKIPAMVPLFYSQATSSWTLSTKDTLIYIPVVFLALLVIISRLNYSIFNFDRRLATVINISLICFDILFLLAFSQLLSIVLIY